MKKIVIDRPAVGAYLTRWVMIGDSNSDVPTVFLHRFHRSGDDAPHNHPWPFTSIILSGGYNEWTPIDPRNPGGPMRKKWYGPGRVLRRPAKWVHRVEIPPGRECWTMIFRGRKEQSWGFFCANGFMPWRQFQAKLDAGSPNPCE